MTRCVAEQTAASYTYVCICVCMYISILYVSVTSLSRLKGGLAGQKIPCKSDGEKNSKALSRCKKIFCVNVPSLYVGKIMGWLIRTQYICTYMRIFIHTYIHTHLFCHFIVLMYFLWGFFLVFYMYVRIIANFAPHLYIYILDKIIAEFAPHTRLSFIIFIYFLRGFGTSYI